MFSVGMWVWNLSHQATTYPLLYFREMVDLGLKSVVVKILDGEHNYNGDLLKPTLDVAKSLGLHLWVWGYERDGRYADPSNEGARLGHRATALSADGIVVDVEKEWDLHDPTIEPLMSSTREEFDGPIYVSTYSHPDLHPEFPWDDFNQYTDGWMPQVYQSPPDVKSVLKSFKEFKKPTIPIGPVDPALGEVNDLKDFLTSCQRESIECSLWSWDHITPEMKVIVRDVIQPSVQDA